MKRNEEQQRRLEMSNAHVGYAILFFVLVVFGSYFIGGLGLTIMGVGFGGAIFVVWIAFAIELYEDSKNPMVGRKEPQFPKELQELINKAEGLEEQNVQD